MTIETVVPLKPMYRVADYMFGYSTNTSAKLADINNWQDGNVFYLPEGVYLFFAKKKNGNRYFKKVHYVTCSDSCMIVLNSIKKVGTSCHIIVSSIKKINQSQCSILVNSIKRQAASNCSITVNSIKKQASTPPTQTFVGVIGVDTALL